MPVTYGIDKQRRLVISTGLGSITYADLLGHQNRLLKDPDFDPSFSQIMDFTRMTSLKLEPSEVRNLAQRNIFSPDSHRAIAAVNDLEYGFGRMFGILRENEGETGIRVFRSLDEAVDWVLSKSTSA
ncbi:MAG TPA: hypothetical protein VJO16_17600 [Candidatus Acidoferrum sp.]|nr:hypothetical protein [Candidatus Acidoferrum sp.]